VIALVTQFDDPAAMPSGATPSGASSSSSCCCCCVVTAVGTSIFSGMHVRRIRLEEGEEAPETAPSRIGFPGWPEILAFLALPLAITLIFLGYAGGLTGAQPILLGVLLWWLLLAVAYRHTRDKSWILHPIATLILAPFIGLFEVVVWLAILS
jgi:hypothetical protein